MSRKLDHIINYGKQSISQEDIQSVISTLRSDFITQGPKIVEFENRLTELTKAKYCVAVSSGTAALHIAVASLDIKPGYTGITSPISFIASSNSMIYNRIKPDFADVDSKYFLIDPDLIKQKLSSQIKLIMPVHFTGNVCDMVTINKIKDDYQNNSKIYIIEDAAHALGSKYSDGTPVGSCKYSDLTIFSFHPVKSITTGEGGAITTNNKELYHKLLLLRNHGIYKEPEFTEKIGPWYYEMVLLGFNYRLSDIHASLGISQLNKIDKFLKRRQEIADIYNDIFRNKEYLSIPQEVPTDGSSYHLYVLQIDFKKIGKSKQLVMEKLKKNYINTQVHYIPIHTHPYYKDNFNFNWGDFPKSEKYYRQALSIPIYPKLSDFEVNYVAHKIIEVLEN